MSVWISGRLRKPDNGPTSGRHVEFGGGRFGKRFGLARTDRSETAEAAGVDVWPRGTIGDHGNLVIAGGECGRGRESSRRAAHVEDAVAGEPKPAGQRNRQPTTPDWTARNITALRTRRGNTPSTNGGVFDEGELIPVGLDIGPLAEARQWSDIGSTRGVWRRKVRETIRAGPYGPVRDSGSCWSRRVAARHDRGPRKPGGRRRRMRKRTRKQPQSGARGGCCSGRA
ncbi:hypothetical protein quinque_006579 [Culex quinquefasciatus]